MPYSKSSFDHLNTLVDTITTRYRAISLDRPRASSTRRDTFTTSHFVKEQPTCMRTSSWPTPKANAQVKRLPLTTARSGSHQQQCLLSGGWWRMTGSNRRPPACKAGALPAELIPRQRLVGLVGLEPTTPALSRRCSNHLSYRPLAVTLEPTDKCERST